MVETHVAGLAGLGLLGLGLAESMTRMAILAVHAVPVVLAFCPGGLIGDALAVAPAAALLSGDEGIGLPVGIGHGAHGHVAEGVFSVEILVGLILVALGAGLDGGKQSLVHVVVALVAIPMATGAVHFLGHHTAIEIGDQVRGDLGVALLTLRREGPWPSP